MFGFQKDNLGKLLNSISTDWDIDIKRLIHKNSRIWWTVELSVRVDEKNFPTTYIFDGDFDLYTAVYRAKYKLERLIEEKDESTA